MLSGPQLSVSASAFSCLARGLHQAGGFNLSGGRSGFPSACPSCRLSTYGAPPTGRTISLPSTSADLSFFPFIISLDCPTKSQTTVGIERTLLKDQGEGELSKVPHSRMGSGRDEEVEKEGWRLGISTHLHNDKPSSGHIHLMI